MPALQVLKSSTSPGSRGTEASWKCCEGALGGRSPEGSWLGWAREATPVTTGTGQRPAEGEDSTKGESRGVEDMQTARVRQVSCTGPLEPTVNREASQDRARQNGSHPLTVCGCSN